MSAGQRCARPEWHDGPCGPARASDYAEVGHRPPLRLLLREGLPYGWWRREAFWAGAVSLVSGLVLLVLMAWTVAEWWTGGAA